jgi:glucose-6-phosphate 1-dehydrogenase
MDHITIILFGATGDLAKRKIIPALYKFFEKKECGTVSIIGVAFDDVTSDHMIEVAYPFLTNSSDDIWDSVKRNSYYKKINFTHASDFIELEAFVKECERTHGSARSNRLFYVATSADFFCDITRNSVAARLMKRTYNGDPVWHRILYEKPFGHDGESARAINRCIQEHLEETQIYRIDHYLTKEVVSNIAMLRFTNCIFEPLWSNRYIDQVQIILSETGGIENRGAYYDNYGALKDVVQNHMLELLALICMESPEKLTGDYIRTERAKIIEKVRFVDGILGQYAGYQQENFVSPDSQTETYASLRVEVATPRWIGVPFYLKTGKNLDKKETSIHIKFKQVDCLLTKGCPTESNWLTLKIDPDAVFSLTLNIKKPGTMESVIPINMEFCHSCIFGLKTPQAYEVLLEEIIRGEQSLSVRFDEIEYAWNLIDAIVAHALPVYRYAIGSQGPQEEMQQEKKHGMRWHS